MMITSLQLKSFRSFSDTEILLNAPRVFLAGLNGSGKSTIREAIKWALTGRCQGLDGKGAGGDKLIPSYSPGSQTVDVALRVNDVVGIERSWAPNGSSLEVEGFAGSATEQQRAIYADLLHCDEAYVDAALDTTVFRNLHHADAKALMLALLDVKVPVGDTEYTLDGLEAAYQKAFKDRKSAKDKVKGAFVPPVATSTLPSLQNKTLADKDAHLAGIAKLLVDLRLAVGDLQQKIGGSVAQRKDLVAKQERLKATGWLTSPIPVKPEGLYEDVVAKIVDVEERLGMMEEAQTEEPAPVQRPADNVDIDTQRKKAAALRTFDPKGGCVLDSRTPCPVAKVKFFSRARDIEDAIEKLAPPAPAEPVAPKPKNPLVAELADLQAKKAAFVAYAQAAEQDQRLVRELEAEIAAVPDTSALETDLGVLTERVNNGQAIEKAAIAFYAGLQAHADAIAHRTTLEADVTRLEALVDVLGPNGARVQALAKALGPFEAVINSYLQPFGWTVGFQVDPWAVLINGRLVDTYSRSEQHRIGVALQLAIAEKSGLKFAIVDELDMLDVQNRELMARALYGSTLDQVILLSTREVNQPLPDASKIAGMICVRLGKGVTGRSVVLEHSQGVAA
jgi:hypothetical protein